MKFFRNLAAIIALALVFCSTAHAQTVVKQPAFTPNQQWVDLGNGPLDLQLIDGNGVVYSSQGSGVGSGTTTTITLTATPAIAPCVGCLVSGIGVTSGTTVTAFNGTTTITTNTTQTIAASTALSWGAACPASTAANVPGVSPGTVASLSPGLLLRSGAMTTYPLYTQSRLCAYGGQQSGVLVLSFPIGAH